MRRTLSSSFLVLSLVSLSLAGCETIPLYDDPEYTRLSCPALSTEKGRFEGKLDAAIERLGYLTTEFGYVPQDIRSMNETQRTLARQQVRGDISVLRDNIREIEVLMSQKACSY